MLSHAKIVSLSTLLTLGSLASGEVAHGADGDAFQRSYMHEAKGHHRRALSALDGLSSAAKSSYLHWLRRGWLLYQVRDYRASISAYQKATAKAPKALEPVLGLSLPQAALRLWLDTSRSCKRALAMDKDNYAAASRLAHASYQLGRNSEAAKLYRRLVALYPSNMTMRSGLGWALLKGGDKAGAKKQFETILRFAPKHASALSGMSWVSR